MSKRTEADELISLVEYTLNSFQLYNGNLTMQDMINLKSLQVLIKSYQQKYPPDEVKDWKVQTGELKK